ncbi:MAG: TIGR02206 family membrane protein [Rhodovulum sp.]|nr:TIGR02206 family membrane protein [Rhodovulum sp.]
MDVALGGLDVFTPYGGLHALSVLACGLAIAAVVRLGRRLPAEAERRLRTTLVTFAGAVWVIYNIAWNWNGIDIAAGLPLHVCDVGGLVAPLALLTQRRWLRATLYFWAFALTTQAFVQPTLTHRPTSLLFWGFWLAHTIILGFAVYDLAVLGFRPGWADFRRAAAVTLAYVAVVFVVNIGLGSNYAYVGNPADPKLVPPFVALLGPWPARVPVMAALAGLAFVLVLLPWRLRGKPVPPEAEPAR